MLKILIADDHDIIRKGLRQILLEEFTFAQIEEVTDGAALVEKVKTDKWDVVISDLAMPRVSGLQALEEIRKLFPQLPVLILSIHPSEQYAPRILKAGASGYLCKDTAPQELVNAVKLVLQGRKYLPPHMISQAAIDAATGNTPLHMLLSARELDVFKMVVTGKSLTEIAELLSLGITTVSTYRTRILEKMKMKSNGELTRYAVENNLL